MRYPILSLALILSCCAIHAGVPLSWTVETSRAQPATFEAYHGESLDLAAALQSYGKPLAIEGEPHLFWQTNGMDSAYWIAPASVTTNGILRATFRPEYDVGAAAYNGFIGVTGSIYRAHFNLRMRPSPGATPNEIPLPTKTLDLSTVTILHPESGPWATTSHTHAQSDVSGLSAALAAKAPLSHTHAQSDVSGLSSALAGKANTSHTHAQSDVSGLSSALAGKANTSHTHAQSDVSGLSSALANKANLSGGNIFYGDQWIANGDLNLVAAGFYVDRTGTGQQYIDGRWNGDYWAFMGTKRFLLLNGLDFSSAMGAEAPTIDGSAIATVANLASKQDTLTAGENITISNNVISATGGSSPATPGWYIPGDWRVNVEVINTPEQKIFIDLETSAHGCVYSNETAQLVYNLAANLSTESLDLYAIDPPPPVTYSSDNPDAIISNNLITATVPGLFRVNATTAAGDTRATSVPLSRRPTISTEIMYYAKDVAASNSYVKSVNDAFLTDLSSLVSDHVSHPYKFGFYKKWNFPSNKINFISGNTSDRHYLISPHVVATADHFPGAYTRNFTATFGNNTLSVIGAGKNTAHCWNLADWAKQHGYTDAEVNDMHISDIAIFIANTGSAASSDCPYFISQTDWERRFGNEGQSILGWATTQTNTDKKKAAQPMAIKCDIRNSISFAAASEFGSWQPLWKSSAQQYSSPYNQHPCCRYDVRAYLDSLGTQEDYWQFPSIYEGDSGSPVFLFYNNNPILVSHFYTMSSGPNWIKALPVLRDFCNIQVKETLGLSTGDTIKEVQ